ncbi:hypothetical protein DFH11DRAFT_988472 [Phellopilus nigrolimitatus]|nr:hypothetical protein DFH11DRAFT_988472 [Phellopilus nigrolimitatus]
MDTRMNGALRTSSGALPNEIMAELFIFCLDSDHLGCMTPSPTTAPLVLTQVCRKWRNIALASPRLWTGISLNDEDLKGSLPLNSKQLLPLLDSWVAQSGSRPISIRLSYTKLPKTGEYSDYRKEMRLVVDRLLRCQHRWYALDLNVLDLFTVQPLLDAVALPDNVPLLRRFIVEVPERSLDSVNTRTNDLALWHSSGLPLSYTHASE